MVNGSQPQRRRRFASRRRSRDVPSVTWRVLLACWPLLLLTLALAWIGATVRLLAKDDRGDAEDNVRLKGTASNSIGVGSPHDERRDADADRGRDDPMVALELELDPDTTIAIRISVASSACPKAYEFLTWMIERQREECAPCTVYRGEPVPPYWGSPDRPDRWDNGGRWGPPYALVQGGFPNRRIRHVERENNRPPVRRGSVAWAGPRGVHFFVALADHPEWKDEHTVWGRVEEADLPLLDALVDGSRPLTVLEHNVPVVTNFVDPIPFRIREYP